MSAKPAAKVRSAPSEDVRGAVAESDPSRHAPYSVEVEQALLGSFIMNNRALDGVSASLNSEQFYDPLHGRIYEVMLRCRERGDMAFTPLTLHAEMKSDPGLVEAGGFPYFVSLAQAAPALPNVRDYVRILHDLAARRSLIRIGEDMVNAAYEAPRAMATAQQIQETEAALRVVREHCAVLEAPLPVLTSAEFVQGFRAPDYVLRPVAQRGFLYSLTGATGAGKTAIGLRFIAHVALGQPLAGRDVEQGRCLMLVGENADDVRARWIALGEHMGFFPAEIAVDFWPAIFSIREALPQLQAQAERVGGYSVVIVDTSAAYFEGDDENGNKEAGDHARIQRSLTRLQGNPLVIANCHPTKNASENNLLPRGGGAFVAEMDGNLTAAKKDGSVELHWQGKFRGPEFEPISFELITVTSDALRDSGGRHVPTVIARPLLDHEQKARAEAVDHDLQRLIAVMEANPNASLAVLAEKAGWFTSDGSKPAKSKSQRLMNELKKQGLAVKELTAWALTDKGEKAAKRIAK